ncbi:hypothetical protein BDF14DRAFT_1853212 [Spinellus fusiger]|nr:hypothetical protein BDF14DRAFT_1853212 [Spinellus fusiger]
MLTFAVHRCSAPFLLQGPPMVLGPSSGTSECWRECVVFLSFFLFCLPPPLPLLPLPSIVMTLLSTPETPSLVFCYYVSGHGWGHATRANQIITDILQLPAHHTVHVISNASEFIFRGVTALGAHYRYADIDAGVVQPLAYTVDRHQTIANLKQFLERRPQCLADEVKWLQHIKADCVVCDAPFLPCAAAAGANIPSVVASNFTFDEVYSGLCEGDAMDTDIQHLVKQVVADYQHADLLIQLPGAIRIPSFYATEALVPLTPVQSTFPDLTLKGVVNGKHSLPWTSVSNVVPSHRQGTLDPPAFERRIVDIPLVFRKYRTERDQVLQSLGIPNEIHQTHKVLLLSFGGQQLGQGEWSKTLPLGWICVVCGTPDAVVLPRGFYRAPRDAYVPDLTHAADVVLGKLGYGTCSECIGHQTPFIYVSRPQFVEEHGLLKLMKDQGSVVELSREDFEAGVWADAIEEAGQMLGHSGEPSRWVAHNGGSVAAQLLQDFVRDWNVHYGLQERHWHTNINKGMSLLDSADVQ